MPVVDTSNKRAAKRFLDAAVNILNKTLLATALDGYEFRLAVKVTTDKTSVPLYSVEVISD